MKNHLCGKNSEISARNRKRNVRGRTDGKCQREQEETQEYENERQVMYMDLTDMISGGTEEQQVPEQKLTKEEYAAKNSRKEKRYGLK